MMRTTWRRRPAGRWSYRPSLEVLERRLLLSASSLDPTFGNGGMTTIPLFANSGNIADGKIVALQADGKIVVVGEMVTNNDVDFAVARLNADGSLDAGFGTGGKTTIPFNFGGTRDALATGVALQSDGKIVVVGSADTGAPGAFDFAAARLNADGSLDATFGSGGKTTIPFDLGGSNNDDAHGVALQADGKIVVVGSADTGAPGGTDIAAARLNPNGSLDATFGTGGKATVDVSGAGGADFGAEAMTLQSDGKIVLAGATSGGFGTGHGSGFTIVRLSAAGTLDTGFGNAGMATVDTGPPPEDVGGVAIQPNGRILASGASHGDLAGTSTIVRLFADGSPDTSFGGGQAAVDLHFGAGSASVGVSTMALQSDGKIVLAGGSFVVRLLGDSQPVTTPPTPTPRLIGTPPAVTGQQVVQASKGGPVTGFLLTFNEALDPASAQDLHHYALLVPGKVPPLLKGKGKKHKVRPVVITSAVYDPVAHTVRLTIGKLKSTDKMGLLEVMGVADPFGDVLSGTTMIPVDLRPKHKHLGLV
jgi:uncharacterized delta-60 repeat protein